VHFLYELIEEGAQQSFGLYVAKLAGLPRPILKKAKEVLEVHEKMSEQKTTPTTRSKSYQLSFFEQISAPSVPEYLSQIEHDLASLDLFKMTPIDAMVKLREYQQKVLQ
jgi:DNA mismatch repair protein MutS